jgi:hypothetical protein
VVRYWDWFSTKRAGKGCHVNELDFNGAGVGVKAVGSYRSIGSKVAKGMRAR